MVRTGEGLGWSHAQRRHPWGRTAHDWVQGWSVPNEELCLYPQGSEGKPGLRTPNQGGRRVQCHLQPAQGGTCPRPR